MAGPLRIGMLTPSANTCLEPITAAMAAQLDPQISVHFSRIRVQNISLEERERAQFDFQPMLEAARLLADAEVDVIAWNGTAGSWLGPEYDRSLCRRLSDETGIPATTSTLAFLDAFRAFGLRRLSLALPYTADVARQIVATYAAAGIRCVAEEHLDICRVVDMDRVPEERMRALIRSVAVPESEAVALVCTNFRGATLAAPLEPEIGIPVLDSVTATLWQALDMVAPRLSIGGWGTLAASGSLRLRLQPVVERLREQTAASRTTARLDWPAKGLSVNGVAAEAREDGVRSLRREGSLDQRRLETVRFMEAQREILVQNDFTKEPYPPQALIDAYGVQAQMLGPLVRDGALMGWLSVHQNGGPRHWSEADIAALRHAVAEAGEVIEQLAG